MESYHLFLPDRSEAANQELNDFLSTSLIWDCKLDCKTNLAHKSVSLSFGWKRNNAVCTVQYISCSPQWKIMIMIMTYFTDPLGEMWFDSCQTVHDGDTT